MAGALVPALLNKTSNRPKVSCVLAKRARTEAGAPMSVGTTRAREPDEPAVVTVASKSSLRRPARATAYPSCNSASATLLPMPVPAPVTIATFMDALMRHISFSANQIRCGQGHYIIKHASDIDRLVSSLGEFTGPVVYRAGDIEEGEHLSWVAQAGRCRGESL